MKKLKATITSSQLVNSQIEIDFDQLSDEDYFNLVSELVTADWFEAVPQLSKGKVFIRLCDNILDFKESISNLVKEDLDTADEDEYFIENIKELEKGLAIAKEMYEDFKKCT